MSPGKIVRSPHIKMLIVLGYIIIITLFDVYCYGIIYQEKIKKENYHPPVWSWVFWESGAEHVMHYRIIQKTLELGGILLVLYFCGLWPAVGLVLSHYMLSYDMLFYLILNPSFINELERTVNPYWLQNWYQIGYIILKPFNSLYFYVSGTTGLLIAVLFCYIPLRKDDSIPPSGNYNTPSRI